MTKKIDPFRFRCQLRWSDLDAQGHVNNAMMLAYLQEARVAFLQAGPSGHMLDDGVVVVSHHVTYKAPIAYREEGVEIALWIGGLGGSRYQVCYEVTQGEKLVAEARTVLCPIDFATGRPRRLEASDREYLAGFLSESEAEWDAPPTVALDGRGTKMPIHVRWNDLDRYGHVNNAVVFDYVQEARIYSTTQWDPGMARTGTEGSEYLWLVATQDVTYLRQIAPGEISVCTAPQSVGNSSITLVAEVLQDGEVAARARTVLVCATPDGKPTSVPEATRHRLAPHQISD